MRTLLSSLFLLSVLTACQSGLPAAQTSLSSPSPVSSPTPGPAATAEPGTVPAVIPTAAPGARFSLSPEYLKALASFSIKAQPDYQLETTVRFTIKNLAASADAGEASTQWRFSAASLRARTTPLLLEVPFLKAGEAYSFEIHFVSDNQHCEFRADGDLRSIYPAAQAEAVTSGGRGKGPDELNLTGSDFSLMMNPLPLHGRVLLPDGRPGRDLKVQIANADGSVTGTVMTDMNGYYVTPRYTSYGPSPRISVVALSDQAAFRTYTATATVTYADGYVCAENLSRNDIQLQAP